MSASPELFKLSKVPLSSPSLVDSGMLFPNPTSELIEAEGSVTAFLAFSQLPCSVLDMLIDPAVTVLPGRHRPPGAGTPLSFVRADVPQVARYLLLPSFKNTGFACQCSFSHLYSDPESLPK